MRAGSQSVSVVGGMHVSEASVGYVYTFESMPLLHTFMLHTSSTAHHLDAVHHRRVAEQVASAAVAGCIRGQDGVATAHDGGVTERSQDGAGARSDPAEGGESGWRAGEDSGWCWCQE